MPTYRTIFRYHFMLGNKIVNTGITVDPDYRQAKLRKMSLEWSKGRLVEVGDRVGYRTAAAWQDEQRKQGRPVDARPT